MMKCEVLFPHCRYICDELMMFEPMLSGIVDVPDDDETQAAIEANWLRPIAAEAKP